MHLFSEIQVNLEVFIWHPYSGENEWRKERAGEGVKYKVWDIRVLWGHSLSPVGFYFVWILWKQAHLKCELHWRVGPICCLPLYPSILCYLLQSVREVELSGKSSPGQTTTIGEGWLSRAGSWLWIVSAAVVRHACAYKFVHTHLPSLPCLP